MFPVGIYNFKFVMLLHVSFSNQTLLKTFSDLFGLGWICCFENHNISHFQNLIIINNISLIQFRRAKQSAEPVGRKVAGCLSNGTPPR